MPSALVLSVASLPVALVSFAVVRQLYTSLTSTISEVPGPGGGHWLWGHEMMIFEKSCGDAYIEWIQSFGTTFKIKGALFHPDILITADPGAIAQILGKDTYSYVKSPVIRPVIERLVGRGLIWAEGHIHKRQRHQLGPFFTTQATQGMFDVIDACAQTGADRLTAYVNATADLKHESRVDIMDWTGPVTLDIIGRVSFDHDFGCGESKDAKAIHRSWKNQVNAGLQRMGFVGILVLRAFPFLIKLPLKVIKSQEEVKAIVQSIGRSMVEQDAYESKNTNFLSTLARLAATEGSGISKQELLDQIATFTMAGNETTASSLGFACYELARRPDVQKRLREEIAELGHEPTYADYIDRMPWLDAITKEIFRLHPPVADMERTVAKDDILRLQTPLKGKNGHEMTHVPIKAGQLIHIPLYSIGRLKSVWGGDAAEFQPDRWLDVSRLPSASDTPPGWNGLMVFSSGPRICIGYRLAVLEFKVILATYVRRFEFHDTGAIVQTKFVGTLQSFVVGEEEKGKQLPVRVSLIDT